MIRKELHQHLDELYGEKKSRGFIYHLVRSYLPPNKVEKVWVAPKRNFHCALSKTPLIEANELLLMSKNKPHESLVKDFLFELITDENYKSYPIKQITEYKELGVTSEKSETFLAYSSYIGLYEWVLEKVREGDKFFLRFIEENDYKELLDNALKDIDESKLKNRIKELKVRLYNTKKTTLGDLDEFQKLKKLYDGN